MACHIVDDRTPEQRETHRYLVVASDEFMSRWASDIESREKGRTVTAQSYAAWACESRAEANECMVRVMRRPEMKRVRVVYDTKGARYRPKSHVAHLYIYVYCGQDEDW